MTTYLNVLPNMTKSEHHSARHTLSHSGVFVPMLVRSLWWMMVGGYIAANASAVIAGGFLVAFGETLGIAHVRSDSQ